MTQTIDPHHFDQKPGDQDSGIDCPDKMGLAAAI
jgi:hypothetical protein